MNQIEKQILNNFDINLSYLKSDTVSYKGKQVTILTFKIEDYLKDIYTELDIKDIPEKELRNYIRGKLSLVHASIFYLAQDKHKKIVIRNRPIYKDFQNVVSKLHNFLEEILKHELISKTYLKSVCKNLSKFISNVFLEENLVYIKLDITSVKQKITDNIQLDMFLSQCFQSLKRDLLAVTLNYVRGDQYCTLVFDYADNINIIDFTCSFVRTIVSNDVESIKNLEIQVDASEDSNLAYFNVLADTDEKLVTITDSILEHSNFVLSLIKTINPEIDIQTLTKIMLYYTTGFSFGYFDSKQGLYRKSIVFNNLPDLKPLTVLEKFMFESAYELGFKHGLEETDTL